ncbi:glycine dehydrogenase (aminomethyl-transferring), partial [Roseomonas sp. DSM 102946]|nr:glycine dehydrogenase (aminomethyl-transferring) [Roseomonas sp. DSM 102946]
LEQLAALEDQGGFVRRHLGPSEGEIAAMLEAIGADSLDAMTARTVPAAILGDTLDALPPAIGESEVVAELAALAAQNSAVKSLIGMGYHGTHVPPVILRNVLENPGWYTAYTPYQAEIAQGRLEALVNFQTMVADLTGLPVANASLLDEGTAAAEAMVMALAAVKGPRATNRRVMLVSRDLHPQTLAVLRTRGAPLGIEIRPHAPGEMAGAIRSEGPFAAIFSYPGTTGELRAELEAEIKLANDTGVTAIVAADPLALVRLKPPGEMGADIVIGSSQR